MKTIKYLLLFLLAAPFNHLFAQQISTADLQVNGLTCSMCSQATEKSLKTLSFVESIKPDLNTNVFTIKFKKDLAVNIDLIKKKVQDAGFSVGNLTATFNLNDVKADESGQLQIGQDTYKFLNGKNKMLTGEVKVTIVDKNFVPSATFKQKATQFKEGSYQSGYGMVKGIKTRIYHVVI
ncbi:copper chaperone CopZ [Pedobacter sp. UYP24]